MLGLDPLYVANEGKLIAVVPSDEADRLLAVMVNHPLGCNAAVIGEVVKDHPGMVVCNPWSAASGWSRCCRENSCLGFVDFRPE